MAIKSYTIRLFILLVIICVTNICIAQELRCNVTVNSDQIQGTNKSVFNTLEQTLSEYINSTTWTDLTFADSERIECNMMLIVKAVSPEGLFTCEWQIQSRRPVYQTTYSTPVLNLKDDHFIFTYQEFDRIEFQPNQFTNNLSALIAYYCYLIIGLDMDTYSRLGGTPYFQICENIVQSAQSSSLDKTELTGWKAFESNRNRYALINNLMDETFRKYREYVYEYHRLGLDEMADNVANGRARIASGIDILREVNRARPATYAINTFINAKADKLVNIFQKGTSEEKKTVYELLMDIDPTRQATYDKINQ